MELYYIILFFILGTVLGSFYNVVGYRLPKNESIIYPKHSYCPNCHHTLSIGELIPIFSFLFQRGKCRHCHHAISFFYPFIEVLTGVLFAVSYYSFGFSYQLVISLSLSSLFSIVIVSDLTYLIIPDEVTAIVGLIIAGATFWGRGYQEGLMALGSGVLLFGIMYSIMLLGDFLFKRESLGGADIKLMFIAGLSLGTILGILVIFISSVVALPIALSLYITNKEKVVPYGPFIVFSILLLFLLKVDVNSFWQLLI